MTVDPHTDDIAFLREFLKEAEWRGEIATEDWNTLEDALGRLVSRIETLEAERDEARQSVGRLKRALAKAKSARDDARKTSSKLNRRATQAESVVMQTVEDCRRQGVSVGRSLANAACNYLTATMEAAEARAVAAERERDEAQENLNALSLAGIDLLSRAMAAERRLADTTKALQAIASCNFVTHGDVVDVARKALAGVAVVPAEEES